MQLVLFNPLQTNLRVLEGILEWGNEYHFQSMNNRTLKWGFNVSMYLVQHYVVEFIKLINSAYFQFAIKSFKFDYIITTILWI